METITHAERLARSCAELVRRDAAFGERLAALERGALRRLFDACFDPVYARAWWTVGRVGADAEALTQDVFLSIRERLQQRASSEPLAPWVERILAEQIRRHRARAGSGRAPTPDRPPSPRLHRPARTASTPRRARRALVPTGGSRVRPADRCR